DRRPACCVFCPVSASTEVYTLSLHDALPISGVARTGGGVEAAGRHRRFLTLRRRGFSTPGPPEDISGQKKPGQNLLAGPCVGSRSEEHTSELQSRENLVCRLLLEKKKQRAAQ